MSFDTLSLSSDSSLSDLSSLSSLSDRGSVFGTPPFDSDLQQSQGPCSWIQPVIVVLGVVLIVLVIYCFISKKPRSHHHPSPHHHSPHPAPPSGTLVDLPDEAAFNERVMKGSGPIVVAFVAQGCGWCEKFKPELAKLVKIYGGPVYTMHAQNAGPILERLGISGFPHLVVFEDGRVKTEQSGYVDLQTLKKLIMGLV